jgi:biofilm protein TabA
MITDLIGNVRDYCGLVKGFELAASFLRKPGVEDLEAGKYLIKGNDVFAMVQYHVQKGRAKARLESHRKFIDIHYVISGSESIGHSILTGKTEPSGPYELNKDIQFFKGKPQNWITLDPGCFAIFLPQDLHAPVAGRGVLKKIVVKIRI